MPSNLPQPQKDMIPVKSGDFGLKNESASEVNATGTNVRTTYRPKGPSMGKLGAKPNQSGS